MKSDMSRRPRRVRVFVRAAATAAALTLAPASAAGAKIDGDDLRRADVVRSSPEVPPSEAAGGYVACDPEDRAISGGSYWHVPGSPHNEASAEGGPLVSASITGDVKGWYGDSDNLNAGTRVFEQYAVCLRKRKLKGSLIREKTIPAGPISASYMAAARVRCPRRMRAVSGGAFWHRPQQGPDAANPVVAQLSASFPLRNGRAWYADGANVDNEQLELTVRSLCVPRRKLARIAVVMEHDSVAAFGYGGDEPHCRRGHRALTGGAYWHRPGASAHAVIGDGIFGGTAMRSARSWYVSGRNYSGFDTDVLTTVVHCLRNRAR